MTSRDFVKSIYKNARVCLASKYPYYMRDYGDKSLLIIDFNDYGMPGECLSFPRDTDELAWENAEKIINQKMMEKLEK